jgi:hypothetical protein
VLPVADSQAADNQSDYHLSSVHGRMALGS